MKLKTNAIKKKERKKTILLSQNKKKTHYQMELVLY